MSDVQYRARRLRKWPVGVVIALAALVAGCADADETPDETEDAAAEESAQAEEQEDDVSDADNEELGELVIAIAHEHVTLESGEGYSSISGIVVRNIQEPLIDRDPNDPANFIPALATDWERVSDTTVRFELREGVTYHDGSQFDAESAAYAVNFVWDPDNQGDNLFLMSSQISAEAVEDYVVEVSTEEPDPMLESIMSFVPLPSMRQLEDDGVDAWANEPIGTGPYKFVSWDRGREIVLEANQEWWGLSDPDEHGEVNFDRVTFLERPDNASRIAAVEAGEADIAESIPAEQCELAFGDECITAPSFNVAFMRFDEPYPLLNDPRVREAIVLSIDAELIAEQIYGGIDLAADVVTPAALGYNPDLEPYDYDPDRARELLDEAAADGVPVEDPIFIGAERGRLPAIDDLGQAIQSMMQDVGLNVDFEAQERATFAEWFLDLHPVPEDRGYIGLHQHANRLFDYSYSTPTYMICGEGHATWCNDEVVELDAQGRTTTDLDEKEAIYQEITRIRHEEFAFYPLFYMPASHGTLGGIEWQPRDDMYLYVKEMRRSN